MYTNGISAPKSYNPNNTAIENSNMANKNAAKPAIYSNLDADTFKSSTNKENYLPSNLNKKEIIAALKDKNKMGMSFFGYKNAIATTITKADDAKLAADNFNILMNAKDKNLSRADVYDILRIATQVNDKKLDEKAADKYGFKGGRLNDEAIDSVLKEVKAHRNTENAFLLQMQMMNQQIFNQQMMHQHMMNQHMMMTTPGMGFC